MNEKEKLENYERFLGEFKEQGNHWDKIEKRTATLFQVLIDGDLKELVFVLKYYPKYIEIVCDHFRYSYNYGGNEADIYAASKLLTMSEGYHQKQFVRNLIRKLPKISDFDITKLNSFLDELLEKQEQIHSIILSFYKNEIERNINTNNYHKLQIKVLEKNLQKLPINNDFDFSASDRDANLDIPYMD
jgi:hypothetical protein